ncbi:MAG: ASKHA domain-containing protein [Planctomycetota bacterium]
MPDCLVKFLPQGLEARVARGTTLLDAAHAAGITLNNICGGDGICGRCRMIVAAGTVGGEVSGKLTRDEIRQGFVLACLTTVEGPVTVQIPRATMAREKTRSDEDAERFRSLDAAPSDAAFTPAPLVTRVFLALDPPTLTNNAADHQRLSEAIQRTLNLPALQMGLKTIRTLPAVLRAGAFQVTATVGLRRDVAEVLEVEPGNSAGRVFLAVIDIGTTTVVTHLVDGVSLKTVDAAACFNAQGVHGREVTARIIASEKKGVELLQQLVVEDINRLIGKLARQNGVALKDILAVVCAGNTVMTHFLLGLPADNIRRNPYIPVTVEPPPLRAAEVGIQVNPRGLLYVLPGISGWVGSDMTAGVLATGMCDREEIALLVDIGTNGEIVIGNREWLVACSASAGPALEGASVECGMRAEKGAVERVIDEHGEIRLVTIGGEKPRGLCGSGIIDAIAVLLRRKIINRSGAIIGEGGGRVREVQGVRRYVFAEGAATATGDPVYLTAIDIENIINAKAAIYAAMQIVIKRLDMAFTDIQRFYIAGAFGNYLDVENAIAIGLLPDIPRDRITFAGNTSIIGAKIAAFYKEAYTKIAAIRRITTDYDLMGADDYIEEFRRAMFLPHTDIEQFPLARV